MISRSVRGSNTGRNLEQRIRRGAVAGVLGTVAMTVPILAGQRLGLVTTPPPVEITANVSHRTSLLPDPSSPTFPLLWSSAHLTYGAGAGIVFTTTFDQLPARTSLAGLVFGLTVWAVSYLGLVPALGLYPGPTEDARSREIVMIVAHGVFGVTIANAVRHLP